MGKKRAWRQGDLSSKNAVGGSRYLHYWFHDSGLQIQDFEAAKKVYTTADETLGKKISEICFNGPDEDLKLTNGEGLPSPFIF